MATKAQIRAEAARIFAAFRQAGADTVEADILQPAETLLDLYGEDIRARAFVTTDPLRGEMMLRPDFTVPIVQMHMRGSGAMARYAYMGEVFRKQEHEVGRPAEYFQAGYELFDAPDAANADAEVFALFAGILAPSGLKAVTGDIGILLAAVEGLATTERRKRALARHIWRPRRFRTLLDRFSGRTPAPPHRKALRDAAAAKGVQVMLDQAGPEIGRRSREEVADRVQVVCDDLAAQPVSQAEAEVLDHILDVRETCTNALAQLRDVAVDLPALGPAIERMARRLEALAAKGVDVDALDFEVSYGRTTMEYYDGFVFGFYPADRPDLPAIAMGGRYDALTRVLGQGTECPAVGGVVRPALLLGLAEGSQ